MKKIVFILICFMMLCPVAFAKNTYEKISCGDIEVPLKVTKVTSTLVLVLEIATPLLVIIYGSIDLAKAVMSQKEEDIKKGQQIFIKRLITGIFVFLVFVIVKTVIGFVAPDSENQGMWNCVDYFINGVQEKNIGGGSSVITEKNLND